MATDVRRARPVALVVALLLVVALWWWDSGEAEPETTRSAGGTSMSPVAPAPDTQSSPDTQTSPGTQSSPDSEPSPDPVTSEVPEHDEAGIPYVVVDDLPVEATEMLTLIDEGGPYEYVGKDGSTFGNFEGLLPKQRRGYYREYTVETPGLSHRGARRIVTGEGGEFYWTADHYESFERIWR